MRAARPKRRNARLKDSELVAIAVAARQRAYAPYSKFAVGAALLSSDGRAFPGVNVENASYGLTVCAERNAVAAAVVAGMRAGDLTRLAIAAEGPALASPCGACRQVLAEFASSDAVVLLHNPKTGANESIPLWDLLPKAFRRTSLPGA
jgi:cytidine deaminase